jgi:N-carbamoylputrescine amidase
MIIQRSHAVANGIPVISCNRVGHEHDPSKQSSGIQFWGNSFICGPQGELLAKAGSEQAEILLSEVSTQRCEQVRRIWPFLRDRRIDSYQDLVKLYRD